MCCARYAWSSSSSPKRTREASPTRTSTLCSICTATSGDSSPYSDITLSTRARHALPGESPPPPVSPARTRRYRYERVVRSISRIRNAPRKPVAPVSSTRWFLNRCSTSAWRQKALIWIETSDGDAYIPTWSSRLRGATGESFLPPSASVTIAAMAWIVGLANSSSSPTERSNSEERSRRRGIVSSELPPRSKNPLFTSNPCTGRLRTRAKMAATFFSASVAGATSTSLPKSALMLARDGKPFLSSLPLAACTGMLSSGTRNVGTM
mmetsp:Transcript_32419/g.76991  ORF Transcript_32419/g.76991 Transcript_32419/m.76991 type:complete len:266 (-) Transcript_32419:1602-2399(-)